MAKKPTDKFISFDRLLGRSNAPNVGHGPVSKGRDPVVDAKAGILDGLKETRVDTSVFANAGKTLFPKISDGVSEIKGIASDFKTMREDAVRELGPAVNTLKSSSRRLLPRLKGTIPEGMYDKLEKATATEETYKSPDKEEVRDQSIQASLESLFSGQNMLAMNQRAEDLVGQHMDRTIGSKRHQEQTARMDAEIAVLQKISAFQDTHQTNYMIKDLTLKYKHLFVAKDTLDTLSTFAKASMDTLEMIKKNTGLPDIQKQQLSETHKEYMRHYIFGKATETIADYTRNWRKNLKDNVYKKFVKPLVSNVKMGAGMADMSASAAEMAMSMGAMDDFGDFDDFDEDSKNDRNKKNKRLKEQTNTLGYKAGKFAANQAAKWGLSTLATAGGKAVTGQYGKNIDDLIGHYVESYGRRASKGIDRMDYDNPLRDLLRAIVPDLKSERGGIEKNLFASGDKAVPWDMMSRTSLVTIIPGLLSRILRMNTITATGTDPGVAVYDVEREQFTDTKTLKTRMTTSLFGDTKQRTDRFSDVVSRMYAGHKTNNGSDEEFQENLPDLINFLQTSAQTGDDFNLTDLAKYAQTGKHTPYTKSTLSGVKNPQQIARMIALSHFMKDGSMNIPLKTDISKGIAGLMGSTDSHIDKGKRFANVFGQRDLLQDLLKQNSSSGAFDAQKVLSTYTDIDPAYLMNRARRSGTTHQGDYEIEGRQRKAQRELMADVAMETMLGGFQDLRSGEFRSAGSRVKGLYGRHRDRLDAIKNTDKFASGYFDGLNIPEVEARQDDVLGPNIDDINIKRRRRSPTRDTSTSNDTVSSAIRDELINIISPTLQNSGKTLDDIYSRMETIGEHILSSSNAPTMGGSVTLDDPTISILEQIRTNTEATTASIKEMSGNMVNIDSSMLEVLMKSAQHQGAIDPKEASSMFSRAGRFVGRTGKSILGGLGRAGLFMAKTTYRDLPLALIKGGAHLGGAFLKSGLPSAALRAAGSLGGGIAKGAGMLGKGYLSAYGGIAKGLGSAIKGAAGLLTNPLYYEDRPDRDVYAKGKVDVGNPLVSARQIREGKVQFADGTIVTDVADINKPVFDKDTKQALITKEQVEAGLVDVNDKPLASGKRGVSLLGAVVKGAGAIGKTGLGILGNFFTAKNPLWGLYGQLFKGAGFLGKGALGMVGNLFSGKGLFGNKGKGGIDKETVEELITSRLDTIISILKGEEKMGPEYDSDDDGIRDNSSEEKARNAEDYKKKAQEGRAAKAQKGMWSSAFAGLKSGYSGKSEEDDEDGGDTNIGLFGGKGKWARKAGRFLGKGGKFLARGAGAAAMAIPGLATGALSAAGGAITAIGTAAAGAMGASMAALPALVTNPVGWAVLGVAAAGAIGYGIYSLLKTDEKTKGLLKERGKIYGITDEKSLSYVQDLEKKLNKHLQKNTSFDDSDLQDMVSSFGMDPKNKDHLIWINTWLKKRFVPAFTLYRILIKTSTSPNSIEYGDESSLTDEQYGSLMNEIPRQMNKFVKDWGPIEPNLGAFNRQHGIDDKSSSAKSSSTDPDKQKQLNPWELGAKSTNGALGPMQRVNAANTTANSINQVANDNRPSGAGTGVPYTAANGSVATLGAIGGGGVVAGMSPDQYKQYKEAIGLRESGGQYNKVNSIGYLGKYQMGAQALEDLGLLNPGASKLGSNKEVLSNPANWKNGMSQDRFLNDPNMQEAAMAKFTQMNFNRLQKGGQISVSTSMKDAAGLVAASHLGGTGNAAKMAAGDNSFADQYGTKITDYRELGRSAVTSDQAVNMTTAGNPNSPNSMYSPSAPVARYMSGGFGPNSIGAGATSSQIGSSDGTVKAPTRDTTVVSTFGMRTINGNTRMHYGIDLRARQGDPIFAIGDGTVINSTQGWGLVEISHDGLKVNSRYLHMSQRYVRTGDHVKAGQMIGLSGGLNGQGISTYDAHLHFEIRTLDKSPYVAGKDNGNVDPVAWMRSHGVNLTVEGGAKDAAPLSDASIKEKQGSQINVANMGAMVDTPEGAKGDTSGVDNKAPAMIADAAASTQDAQTTADKSAAAAATEASEKKAQEEEAKRVAEKAAKDAASPDKKSKEATAMADVGKSIEVMNTTISGHLQEMIKSQKMNTDALNEGLSNVVASTEASGAAVAGAVQTSAGKTATVISQVVNNNAGSTRTGEVSVAKSDRASRYGAG